MDTHDKPAGERPDDTMPNLDLGETERLVARTPLGEHTVMGGECGDCSARMAPSRPVCPNCGGTNIHPAALDSLGTLYSFSVVHVSATREVPYTIGYVDLPKNVRVLAAIDGDPAELRCDQVVRLVPDTGDGWRFAPASVEEKDMR
ncbi:Zn-ribbon domain-containing OB-fold protein [Azospirillum griseum]|uniref:DUF35 domain-containing protein n=1 Tax=Azospirillum griseum TaxID=2496639 RepID=A0A3S0KUT1_9PROT|nr:OB-fold domain-containing protein [Azospirillum griseum]RTR14613.1 hypothetical protein EJ903_23735 [Azospirillum griseum]